MTVSGAASRLAAADSLTLRMALRADYYRGKALARPTYGGRITKYTAKNQNALRLNTRSRQPTPIPSKAPTRGRGLTQSKHVPELLLKQKCGDELYRDDRDVCLGNKLISVLDSLASQQRQEIARASLPEQDATLIMTIGSHLSPAFAMMWPPTSAVTASLRSRPHDERVDKSVESNHIDTNKTIGFILEYIYSYGKIRITRKSRRTTKIRLQRGGGKKMHEQFSSISDSHVKAGGSWRRAFDTRQTTARPSTFDEFTSAKNPPVLRLTNSPNHLIFGTWHQVYI
ncbi:hypothetical protein MKZ38_002152 [Zalerion maritima]|uniref:Uncharacterized protein n=1 Tax=Zalerion maritima TaxID=339359 RepID=A0AAD5RW85_9PEZI|nr:hypothetical protein MKZ38_002152 [Zalerion maritima]